MKITGIGNALVDILTVLKSEDTLKKYNLPKGGMTLVDSDLSLKMDRETSSLEKTMESGGSSANTIHGLASLGLDTSYIGKIGNDEIGEFFLNDMKKKKINPVLFRSGTSTGRVMAFISPDSERTMATYLGAAVELSEKEITADLLRDSDYLYLEGYLINNYDLFSGAIRLGKELGLKVCVDLAAYNIVEKYGDILRKNIAEFVDIVFANEEEAKALTGLDPEDAVKEIAMNCRIAVVKIGAEGSLIRSGDESYHVPAPRVNSVDTTGAGDIYAAGFLYGQVKSLGLERSGLIGTMLASRVVQEVGPKLSEESWREVLGDEVLADFRG